MRTSIIWLASVFGYYGISLCLAADPQPNVDKIGKAIENVTLLDTAGQSASLWTADAKATAVVFLSFECPVSNSYSEMLSDLAKRYAKSGVRFVGIVCNDEKRESLAKSVAEFKLNFPVLLDPKNIVADALKATITPEAFVLDRHHILRYRGRIDNTWAARLRKNQQTTTHELRDAIDAVLIDKPVKTPSTVAIGCPIREPQSQTVADAKVTYYRDVLPILQNHCQSCHRPGQVGPFSLMTYKQAVNWAHDIKEYTQARQMPPWKPTDGPAFQNDRRMPDTDIATLAAWVDAGAPEGNPKDAPPPVKFSEGWMIGTPDLVLTVPEEFQVGPSGSDLFRCFVLPTGLTEDKYVIGLEVKPGNPRVVHHTLNFFDSTGTARKLEEEERRKAKPDAIDAGPGYSVRMGVGFRGTPGKFGGLGGWAPGQIGRYLPEGSGYFLPKGSDLIIQTHYHRTGRLEKDRIQIGLYFAKKPIERPLQSLIIPGRFLFIPPFVEKHPITGTIVVGADCTIYNVMPHMHLLGKSVKITMHPPEGPSQVLVNIDDWNYNWQETYTFKEPIKVKSGTKFEIAAIYDNSSRNPNNPFSPPRIILPGEETTNEMLFGFIAATADKPGRIPFRFDIPKPADKDKPVDSSKSPESSKPGQ